MAWGATANLQTCLGASYGHVEGPYDETCTWVEDILLVLAVEMRRVSRAAAELSAGLRLHVYVSGRRHGEPGTVLMSDLIRC